MRAIIHCNSACRVPATRSRRWLWSGGGGLAALVLLASCRQESPTAVRQGLPENALARVGEVVITTNLFAAERARRASSGPEANDRLLEDLIRRELLYAEAQRLGFDRSSELQAAWKNLVVQRFQEREETRAEAVPAIAPAMVEDYYQQHLERFSTPAQVHSAMIQLLPERRGTDPAAFSQASLAEAIRAEAIQQAGASPGFGELAARHSLHLTTRRRECDLGWLTPVQAGRTFPAAVADALFALTTPGDISPVITTTEGLFLVKLIERRPATPKPLAAVRDQIMSELTRARRAENERVGFQQLRELHPVEVNADRLAQFAAPERSLVSRPPRVPGF